MFSVKVVMPVYSVMPVFSVTVVMPVYSVIAVIPVFSNSKTGNIGLFHLIAVHPLWMTKKENLTPGHNLLTVIPPGP